MQLNLTCWAFKNAVKHFLFWWVCVWEMWNLTHITCPRLFKWSHFHVLSETHSFSFNYLSVISPETQEQPTRTQKCPPHNNPHSSTPRLELSSSPQAHKKPPVYIEVMYRLHFPVLTLFWSANVKFLTAKSLLPRWGFVDIHGLSRGPIRTCWWTLGCLCLGSSESMCDQLRSGRNTWWLLIKLSIPVHVIPPLQTHPHPKKEKKNPSLSHQDKSASWNLQQSRNPTHAHTKKSHTERTLCLHMLVLQSLQDIFNLSIIIVLETYYFL